MTLREAAQALLVAEAGRHLGTIQAVRAIDKALTDLRAALAASEEGAGRGHDDGGCAAAISEAAEAGLAAGFREGIEAAAKVADQYATPPTDDSDYQRGWKRGAECAAAKIRALSPPAPSTPAPAPECATCGDGLFVGSTTLGTLAPCPDCFTPAPATGEEP